VKQATAADNIMREGWILHMVTREVCEKWLNFTDTWRGVLEIF